MWTVKGQEQVASLFEPFTPEEVLVWVDGPRTFTVNRASGTVFLAHWCCGDEAADRYLLVPVTDAAVEQLKTGGVTFRGTLVDASRHYLVDVTNDGAVRQVWRVNAVDVPDDVLPHPDARLAASR